MADFEHISIDGTSYDAVPAGSYVTGVKGNSESTYRSGNVNITKSNIGLANVPNVATNDQTPTFSQATTRANIASGETLTTIFGKIMKWFADLKTVAFSGSYTDLSDKPTIPTVNNATLTIQKNGTNVQTFTANASANKTANITVPTKTSELTNDSGYITDAGVTGVKGSAETNYRTGNVNITKANVGLSNVPNVTTNNQTPTFTQASTLSNIASGEKLSVILGKLMKLFSSLTSGTLSPNRTLYPLSDIQGLGLVTYIQGPPLASNVTANLTSIRVLKNGTWTTLTFMDILLKGYGKTQINFNVPTGWSYDLGKSYTVELTGTITYT